MIWLGPDDDPEPQQLLEDNLDANGGPLPFHYGQHSTGIIRRDRSANGRSRITPLTSFRAQILADRILDDGLQQRRSLMIEAEVGGQKLLVEVSASEFGTMNWVLHRLGPAAIIYPGQQQHARAAIQSLSGPIRQEHVFAHLGWRQHGSDWVYLHAGGAVGPHGLRRDVPVQLSAPLGDYQVIVPANDEERHRAVVASLEFLSLAPDRITFPLLAGVYRAVLGKVDFSLFLTGPSGTFKTALAALCQQHFGAGMDASGLPGSFTSTGNALEGMAFAAKDAVLVVDDFVPVGGVGDGALQGVAERLFRAAGNHQGRSRMDGQGRLHTAQSPRALIVATGEEVPRGQSLRARLLILEVAEGDVKVSKLTDSQSDAASGWLSRATGGYLEWMASCFERVQTAHQKRVIELRGGGCYGSPHRRLPTALAELQSGWEIWLEFARQSGAIGTAEHQDLLQRGSRALGEVSMRQTAYQQESDPAVRFLALLRAALGGGRAHVADRQGKVPAEPLRWGWRRRRAGGTWMEQGARIGWTWNQDVFLEPAISYQMAQQVAGRERLAVSEGSLRHCLRTRGLLASVDIGRQMLVVRRTVEGHPRQLLHLRADDLMPS
jgi:hypothetical protein